ncbi:LytTR family DNA-binding domain-containing protein [Flagellimonas pacifica]|uniref:LytTr DNA-binding domain-containing protein n=1 Tax=Flagellimonas pacifica TaxID=1247520 RepID=A0A285MHB1_9FLAO|nr:LytTR family DNA-binding domain-containing protein [Allomuricauda parva]SNY95346.1 LytTr DNA-binding domain-containing protein [Allomuricauda parva]
MKTKNFLALITTIAIVLGFLIYWREYATRDQVTLIHVLLWQTLIWTPWILIFLVFKMLVEKVRSITYGKVLIITIGVLWIVLHFGWFFMISSNISPYLDLPGSKFGVYRYFFVFWTLIDFGILWFVVDKLWWKKEEKTNAPLLFELTRGGKKHFCEPSQIQWLAAENYYTKLFTTEGVFVMRKPLKSFLDVLPRDNFKKIHRSTIINVDFVSELVRGTGSTLDVVMKDGAKRRVSKSFVKDIIHFFKDRTN